MTSEPAFRFTEEQQALINAPDSVYVEACPGAGKTQSIVQRFVSRPALSDPRRGVALLSFTNAAVDEARSRCSSTPHLTEVPNFVGTIDGFINRFIVGPVYNARTGRTPVFQDTWNTVPSTNVTARGVRGTFGLDWFEIALDGSATLMKQRVPADRRAGVDKLRPDQLRRVTDSAGARWRALNDRGVLNASTSRQLMAEYLGDPETRQQLLDLLSARFAEVIVDEVQDCTASDVLLLELLEDARVKLVCVGDPDQAIYGFRGPVATSLDALLARLTPGARLNGNFRSSPAICALVGSLRHGADADIPMGTAAAVTMPVIVTVFRSREEVRPAVAAILEGLGISNEESLVLAHASSVSRSCAGADRSFHSTNSRLVLLALATHRFQHQSSSPAIRRDALRDLERIICELSGTDKMIADYLETQGITERWFRDCCLRIASALDSPFETAPSQFKARVSELLDAHGSLGAKVSKLRTPNRDQWPISPNESSDALRHSTIHGFKGLQQRAVALVLPRAQASATDDGIDRWIADQPSEARRVLYVGASRAQEVLILATHESRKAAVLAKLESHGVMHVLHGEAAG